ncbi:hypothetical protein ACFV2B_38320, partial [Streptomyces lavendulae]
LLSYLLVGAMVVFVMRMLGEMAAAGPHTGARTADPPPARGGGGGGARARGGRRGPSRERRQRRARGSPRGRAHRSGWRAGCP